MNVQVQSVNLEIDQLTFFHPFPTGTRFLPPGPETLFIPGLGGGQSASLTLPVEFRGETGDLPVRTRAGC